jgi:hypothetical protein
MNGTRRARLATLEAAVFGDDRELQTPEALRAAWWEGLADDGDPAAIGDLEALPEGPWWAGIEEAAQG